MNSELNNFTNALLLMYYNVSSTTQTSSANIYASSAIFDNNVVADDESMSSTTIPSVEQYHPCDPNPFNHEFNCTREMFLVFYRGPQTLPLSIVLSVSTNFVVLNLKLIKVFFF